MNKQGEFKALAITGDSGQLVRCRAWFQNIDGELCNEYDEVLSIEPWDNTIGWGSRDSNANVLVDSAIVISKEKLIKFGIAL